MKYNFDNIINRKNTNSVKWSFSAEFKGHEDCIPMWIADMDFETAPEIKEAIIKRAEHGIYGYTNRSEEYLEAVTNWMEKRHNWKIEKEWLCISLGIVQALHMIVRTFVDPGDKVIVQSPGYYPFYNAIIRNGAQILYNELKLKDGRYEMDFEDLEKKILDKRVRMLILCNPHNPVGRVWNKKELEKIGELCLENDVLVLVDEIHSDLVFKNNKHISFASICKEFENISITCTAPSKTFNLAGLQTSNVIIPNKKLRERYNISLENSGISRFNIFGMVACEAAYRHGEEWLTELLEYIEENKNIATNYINDKIPKLKVISPEGTYLLWIDCRELGLSNEELKKFMIEEAKLLFDEGYIFGPSGEGFERMNLACPREILMSALERLERAIKNCP